MGKTEEDAKDTLRRSDELLKKGRRLIDELEFLLHEPNTPQPYRNGDSAETEHREKPSRGQSDSKTS